VIVTNSGGGTSNAINFTITSGVNPAPTISALFPSCAPAGEQFVDAVNNQLTVVGTILWGVQSCSGTAATGPPQVTAALTD
jgi:hypothetical protein